MKKGLLWALAVMVLTLGWRWLSGPSPPDRAVLTGRTIVCFGDSLTYGTGAPRGMDYPSQLGRMVSLPVINAGRPGDVTQSALARLAGDVLPHDPRMVLITLGGNDLKNGIDPDVAFQNLKQIVTILQQHGVLVVIGGLRFSVWDRGYGKGFALLAQDTGALLVADIYEGIIGNPALMSDAIHPNAAGYARMARHFHQAIRGFL